jgi:hypothetical protein
MDRSGFLKALGLGVAGVATAKLDSLFTPDVEKQIEELKNILSKGLNIEIRTVRTNVIRKEITHRELFDIDLDDVNDVCFTTFHYISSYFENTRKRKLFPDENRVQMAIDIFEHCKTKVPSHSSYIDIFNQNIGVCYLLLEEYKTAQKYFETHSLKPLFVPVENRIEQIKYYYDLRNISFPDNFKFNKIK